MSHKLLIIGAGGHGRCCLEIAQSMNKYDDIAFLDNQNVNKKINDCKVIDTTEKLNFYYPEYKYIFVAIGNNELREKIINSVKEIGYNLETLISSDSYISKYAFIGEGCVIFPKSVVQTNTTIKNGCIISSGAVIDHDVTLNECCHINANAVIKASSIVPKLTKVDYGKVYHNQTDKHWIKEYKEQFGREPSFFE